MASQNVLVHVHAPSALMFWKGGQAGGTPVRRGRQQKGRLHEHEWCTQSMNDGRMVLYKQSLSKASAT